jgi:TRAP-type C4-dicarboxylate transport system permease small subunit
MKSDGTLAPRGLAPRLEWQVGVWVGYAAQALALVGGLVLIALSVLTILSVTGRALIWAGLGPIPGDFELVEAGCAMAVFYFLPWCQLKRGHVTVDVFITWLHPARQALLTLIGNVLLTGVGILIARQLQAGLAERLTNGETTFILQMPVWYGYMASLVGAWLFPVVCAYTVWRSVNEVFAGGEGSG